MSGTFKRINLLIQGIWYKFQPAYLTIHTSPIERTTDEFHKLPRVNSAAHPPSVHSLNPALVPTVQRQASV